MKSLILVPAGVALVLSLAACDRASAPAQSSAGIAEDFFVLYLRYLNQGRSILTEALK